MNEDWSNQNEDDWNHREKMPIPETKIPDDAFTSRVTGCLTFLSYVTLVSFFTGMMLYVVTWSW